MTGCEQPVAKHHSYAVTWNSTLAVYDCQDGYRHQSGHLMRYCINNTWTGQVPSCTVDSVLPKAYLVMLIIGATLSVFVACIPYDFYRFRRRKKIARKHQERLSLMTRIAPGHAKMMTETLPVGGPLPAPQRRFGFRSLIKAFRFVAEKMKTTNGEEDAEAGTSAGLGEAAAATVTGNGGLVTAGQQPPRCPPSPNPEENRAARARMSAVLQLWTGRGQRAKSLDISDESLPRQLVRHKRNSLVTASNSTIQAAATTAATAAAAATAACCAFDEDGDPGGSKVLAAAGGGSEGAGAGRPRRKAQLTTSASLDSPLLDAGPPAAALRFPHVGSARYVQLAASIPEDTDESEDGAFVGGRFKVTEEKKMAFSYSLPATWGDDGVRAPPPPEPANFLKVAPLTQENVAALAEGTAAAAAAAAARRSKDSDTTDSTQGRVDASSERNSLTFADSRAAVAGGDDAGYTTTTTTTSSPRRPPPLQRQQSQDLDSQYDQRIPSQSSSYYDHRAPSQSSHYGDHRVSAASSLATDDSDRPYDGLSKAEIH